MSKYGRKYNRQKLGLLDKLKICWGVITMPDCNYFMPHEKDQFIFNKGYKTGLADTRLPGDYKVVVSNVVSGQELEHFFDDLGEAVKFTKRNSDSSNILYYELFQTYLDRELDHLL